MITRNKALAAVAVVGALALTTSACSSSKSTTGGGGNGGSTFNAAATSIVNPSTKPGGTLKLWSTQDVDSLDPAIGYYAFVWDLQRFYVRSLVGYPSKPGAAGLQLQPDLASAMPTVTNDGKTYTFKLKSGIKFSDGTPVTSKDIKYGIERVFAQDVLPNGPIYLISDLDEGQKYPGPYKDKDPQGLKSVQTPDDSTIVFNLQQANSDFLYHLAMGGASPIEQAKDDGANYAKHPLSTGPYVIENYVANKGFDMVRNKYWDKSTDSLHSALPDKITFTVTTNADDLDSRLLDGSIDVDAAQRGVQTAAQGKILTTPSLKADTVDAPAATIRYISIQTKVAPFDNVDCRKAVEYAISGTDQQTARGGKWAGQLATNMLPPAIPGSDNYDPYNLAAGQSQVTQAKAELAKCGKPNGFSTTIAARSTSPKDVKQAVAAQAALKAIGVTADIKQYDGSQSGSTVGSPDWMHSNSIGLNVFGWGSDYPTGSGMLSVLIDGRLISKSGNNNYSEINDPQINGWIDDAAKASDPATAAADYTKINHRVMDLALYFPGVVEQSLNYYNPRLTNVMFNQELGMLDFSALGTSDGK
ncbi:ABC transporter substrate-binding protein [Streptacidiphilus pinicola]|uniref:ABC transporter substrate-binding protein n=1 Tax=Streptacidiphilus pinicola TaxID=2219663 RepID=A0A2X0K3C1_9ACTN|nr:ABC transporter substrate-binding protein [Streptacidiphilus pinicola]RAG82069.1 ABC transporter substrate-binding protein [Streptacidiphilus pinicola]